MATAYYSQGMVNEFNQSRPSNYISWKGRGIFSNPSNVASGNMRPLTNLDPANSALYKFGLPRPIKHYRKGRSFPVFSSTPLVERDYYSNRLVRSSTTNDMIRQVIDNPGSVITKSSKKSCVDCHGIVGVNSYMPTLPYLTDNPIPKTTNRFFCCNPEVKAYKRVLPASTLLKKNYFTSTYQKLYNRCQTFQQREFNFFYGSPVKLDSLLIDNPSLVNKLIIGNIKPGSPLTNTNMYVANCAPSTDVQIAHKYYFINKILTLWRNHNIINSNDYVQLQQSDNLNDFKNFIDNIQDMDLTQIAGEIYNEVYSNFELQNISPELLFGKSCRKVYYKPNNPRFAQQGAVSSSTRTLFLDVQTIESNLLNIEKTNFASVATLNGDKNSTPTIPFIYKNKTPLCNPSIYQQNGNSKICFKRRTKQNYI
jgi:hypothetical protein